MEKLQNAFGQRLKLVVHVGSWARNDANVQSDIDLNVVVDKVALSDTVLYRNILDSMPDKKIACGFLGGLDEMALWPRYDLVAFHYGCNVLYGNVQEILGTLSRKDIFDNAMIIISTINHAARHGIIYDAVLEESVHGLKDLYKVSFFALQEWYLLYSGEYVGKRQALIEKLVNETDITLMKTYLSWDHLKEDREATPLNYYQHLEYWSSSMFTRMAALQKSL